MRSPQVKQHSASAPALPSAPQTLWDHRRPDTRIKLVLSGSHITAMRQLEEAGQPLCGRRTGRIDVEPFDYVNAAMFLPGYAVEDRLRTYGIFGGIPAT